MKKIYLTIFIYLISYSHGDVVDIKADHFYANDITKVVYFEGNAVINQGDNHFSASKIVVHFNRQKRAERYEAIGDVRFNLIESGIRYEGRAERIKYSPNSSKYLFSGDVVLKDLTNNRKIEAGIISLDLKTGLADIKGKRKKPVHFIFEIEDKK